MRIQGFASSVLFSGVAAVGVVFAQHVFAPVFGSGNVLALYLAGALVVYAGLFGKSPRQGIQRGLVASLGAVAVLALASGIEGVAIGLGLVLAVVRTGLDAGRSTPRRLWGEAILGFGALAFASLMASPGWLGSAAAIWGFALVQSLYFLLPAASLRPNRTAAGDPFERARAELLSLLGEVP